MIFQCKASRRLFGAVPHNGTQRLKHNNNYLLITFKISTKKYLFEVFLQTERRSELCVKKPKERQIASSEGRPNKVYKELFIWFFVSSFIALKPVFHFRTNSCESDFSFGSWAMDCN